MSGPSDEELERRMRDALGVDTWKPGQLTEDEKPLAKKLLGARGLNRHQNLKSGQRYRPPLVYYEFYYLAPCSDPWSYETLGGWIFQKVEDGEQIAIKTGLSEAAVREMAREYQARGLVVKECVTEAYRHQQAKAASKPRPTKNQPVSQRRLKLEQFDHISRKRRNS